MMENTNNDRAQNANLRADAESKESSSQTPFPQFNSPQFGNIGSTPFDGEIAKQIESAKSNGWGAQLSSFISQRKKPVLIAIIAILLFVGGTYLSKNSSENTPEDNVAGLTNLGDSEESKVENESNGAQTLPNEINLELNEDGQIIAEVVGPALPKDESTPKENKPETKKKEAAAVIVEKTGDSITLTADKGDGITHLARQAVKEYLSQNKETLTPEQKIYAEDYIQNRIGSNFLEVGQKLSFSEDLIGEAIAKSRILKQWQIDNLRKYTANISL